MYRHITQKFLITAFSQNMHPQKFLEKLYLQKLMSGKECKVMSLKAYLYENNR